MSGESQVDVEIGREAAAVDEVVSEARLEVVSGVLAEADTEIAAARELLESIAGAPDADAAVATAGSAEDDAALVERARVEPEAFGLLYERYVDRVYAYVYHRVGNVQDAEDLTARTFHRALDALDSYEDRGLPFAAWLFRIAHNLIANWHRDRGRRRFLSLDRLWSHHTDSDSPEGALEKKETSAALWTAINHLPAERRDLLIYKFSSRLSNLEIGELMNKSESAVKSLYFRTLSTLRKELEARGWGVPADESGAPGAGSPAAGSEEEGDRP